MPRLIPLFGWEQILDGVKRENSSDIKTLLAQGGFVHRQKNGTPANRTPTGLRDFGEEKAILKHSDSLKDGFAGALATDDFFLARLHWLARIGGCLLMLFPNDYSEFFFGGTRAFVLRDNVSMCPMQTSNRLNPRRRTMLNT